MLKKNLFLFFLIAYCWGLFAQLQSGPMVGYAYSKEVMLWVQTKNSASVQIEYWDSDNPKTLKETEKKETLKEDGYTAHLIADEVEPGRKYFYRVYINGKETVVNYPLYFKTPALWQHRTAPPEIKIALGSCVYVNETQYDRPVKEGGNPYGGNYEIFTSMAKQSPDITLWLGDNTYLREVDWYSKTGVYHRYTHTRSLPEMQPLLGSSVNLAIWDDHDYGPNDSDRTFTGKEITRKAFKDFWANPSCGRNGEGTESFYEWGDVQFFMTDDRWFRSPNDMKSEKRDYFGKNQLDYLIESLIGSKATFKFVLVGGQVLNSLKNYETLINIAEHERTYLLDKIAKEEIKNVIFLTGDRHHSELSVTEVKSPSGKTLKVYDWTVSPLTSSAYDASKEENSYRVPGSHYGARNFGIMQITGPQKERQLNMKLLDIQGKEVWNYTIKPE
ncbi:MAG: alkaline phosphatase D family protein [Bacteroidia bacterium]|nr:alkaline phosphatase D family protein [Bacteroidia bacterium]